MRLRFASGALAAVVAWASKAAADKKQSGRPKSLSTLEKVMEDLVLIAHSQSEEEKEAAEGEEEPRENKVPEFADAPALRGDEKTAVNQLREIVRGRNEEEILTKIVEIVRRQIEEEKKAANGEEEPRENKVPEFESAGPVLRDDAKRTAPVLRDDAKRTGHKGAANLAGGEASFLTTETGSPTYWYYGYPWAAWLDRDGTSPQTRFEYHGEGRCQSTSGSRYDESRYENEGFSGPLDCQAHCLALDEGKWVPALAGFGYYDKDDGEIACVCSRDKAFLHVGRARDLSGWNAAMGDPDETEGWRCYARRYSLLTGL